MIIINKDKLIVWNFKIKVFEINKITRLEAKGNEFILVYKHKKYKFSGYSCILKYSLSKEAFKTKEIIDKVKSIINMLKDS